jgi:hypothetical protein
MDSLCYIYMLNTHFRGSRSVFDNTQQFMDFQTQ